MNEPDETDVYTQEFWDEKYAAWSKKHPDRAEPGDAREYVDIWAGEFDPAEDQRDYQAEWPPR